MRRQGDWSNAFVEHARVPLSFDGQVSRTRQEFRDECDIDTIMKKYRVTGVISHVNKAEPRYMDFTGAPQDLQSALNTVMDAEAAFLRLPSELRKKLGNDPLEFMKYAADPSNLDELRKYGLAEPLPAPAAPMEVIVRGGDAADVIEVPAGSVKPAKPA